MSWTDDRVSILKKLWGEGKTAAEIAKELGGVTRNAVIGKAHRLKLSNRVSPIQQNKKPVAKTQSPVQTQKQKIQKITAQDNDKPRKALMDLKPTECRWPIGDPKEQSFGFCAGHSMDGLPYCMDHAKVAYQAATRNKIIKAEKEMADSLKVEQPAAKKAVNE